MVDENTIRVAAIQETQYGEKAAIDSPYPAKDYIKFVTKRFKLLETL